MQIISHRGFWQNANDMNSICSLERSLKCNFGVETDIRDYLGEMVISHDIPSKNSPLFEDFLKIYNNHNSKLILALNIKSDGLCIKLKKLIEQYNIINYFVFDMSIPETLVYLKNNINFFIRQSEYEEKNIFYNNIGIWMDELTKEWIKENSIKSNLNTGKYVCMVSPEIHSRDYIRSWIRYKRVVDKYETNKLILCTDLPDEARRFFNENN